MLADSIQLQVLTATPANGFLVARFAQQVNRTDYIVSGHTTAARDQLQIYRTFPKRNGDSLGVRKCAVKYTKDIEVLNALGDTVKMPLIVELSFAIPEGTTNNQIDAALVMPRGLLTSTSAILEPLTRTLEI